MNEPEGLNVGDEELNPQEPQDAADEVEGGTEAGDAGGGAGEEAVEE